MAIVSRIKELLAAKTLTMAGIKRKIEEEFGLARSNPVHPERLRKTLNSVRDELQDIVARPRRRPQKKVLNPPVSAIMGDSWFGTWRSLVAHMLGVHGVGGSNPPVPTIFFIRMGRS